MTEDSEIVIANVKKEIEEKLKNAPCIRCRYDNNGCFYWHDVEAAIVQNKTIPTTCFYKEKYQDDNGYTPDDHQFFKTTTKVETETTSGTFVLEELFSIEEEKYWSSNWLDVKYWHHMPTLKISEAIQLLLNVDPNHKYIRVDRFKYFEMLNIVFSHYKAGKVQLISNGYLVTHKQPDSIFENSLVNLQYFFDWSETLTLDFIIRPTFLFCCVKNISIKEWKRLISNSFFGECLPPLVQHNTVSNESTNERSQRWQNGTNDLVIEKSDITKDEAVTKGSAINKGLTKIKQEQKIPRNQQIKELSKQGASKRELAKKFGISKRQISRILEKSKN